MSPKTNKSEIIAETIINGLKDGTAPWIKPWTPEQSVAPHNPVSGTVYKGVNFMYLSSLNQSDPRWVTFNQAQKQGWQVKKGSKGTVVQYWKFIKEENRENEAGEIVKETVRLQRPLLRHYYVFNASNIEGIPPLEQEPQVNKEWERHNKAENILKNSGAEIEHITGNKAAYNPASDKIVLPQKRQFSTPDGYYVTALHELGHWTGHESRLNREIVNPFGSEKYAREELRAEIASYMVGMQLGIGHDPGQHLAYVNSWVRLLESHPTEIFKACADAEKIRSFVMEFEQELAQTKDVIMEKDKISAMPAMPESQVNERTGKQFISFYANQQHQAPGNITLELQTSRDTASGVLRFENAIEKSVGEKLNFEDLKQAGIDGVLLTENGKPVAAIATNKNQLYPNMYRAAEGVKRHYLSVPYEEKDQAQKFGAVWDKMAKSWYIPDGLDQKPFSGWQPGQSITADNPQQQFAEFIREMGGDLQGHVPEMDGKMHRIPETGGRRGNKNIAYVGYLDGLPAGWVKNFRGEERRWKMSGVVLTNEDRTRLEKEGQEKKTQRAKERQGLYVVKAKESKGVTDKLPPATGKEKYFADKGIEIKDPGVKINPKGNIVIPLRDIDGKQWSHQTLQPNGFKQIFKDSKIQGTFALVGAKSVQDIKGDILIAEGYSTAATIHEVTGKPVIESTTSNNLKYVAQALNERYPDKDIYIMADDDRYLEKQGKINTGQVKAREAAKAVGGHVISPDFSGANPDRTSTDFKDMARTQGKNKVRDYIAAKVELARHPHKNLGKDQDPGRHKGPERSDISHERTAERISHGGIEKTGGLKEANNFELSVKEKSGETHTKQVFVNPKLVSRKDLSDYLEKKGKLFVSSLGIEKHKISKTNIKPVEVKIIRTKNIEMEMGR